MQININLDTSQENPHYVKELLNTLAGYEPPTGNPLYPTLVSDPATKKRRGAAAPPAPAPESNPEPARPAETAQANPATPQGAIEPEQLPKPAEKSEDKKLTVGDCKSAAFPKLDNHRDAIAKILKEYEAESISGLAPKYFAEFINKMNALA